MVKKIFFALILINLIGVLKVNAATLTAPSVFYYENDTPYSDTITTDNWSSTNVYVGPYIGNFGSNFPNITRVDYNWFNLNICSGKNVSISGSVHAIFGFFLNQSYTLSFYMNNEPLVCSTQVFDNGNALHYDCYGDVGGGTFSIYLTENSFTPNINYHTGVSQDVTYSCDVSNEAIVNQSITNTQNIINNQNSTTNQIIQDNQQNTQDIINNQNQNTQQEIESQKVCTNFNYDNNSFPIMKYNYYMLPDKTYVSNNQWNVSDYIPVLKGKTYTYTISSSYPGLSDIFLLFDTNKNFYTSYGLTNSTTYSFIPSQDGYIVINLLKSNNRVYTFSGELCQNGNQALNDSLNGLNDTLNDTSQPNTNQDINDMNDMVASDTPISDLITMPLTLINAYINGVNSSCSPVNLGNLYGTDLTLPCINLEQRLGSNLWHIIDAFFSIFMCYNIGMLFITAFDGITSLRDDFEGLYQPRHADTGYIPKHGGGN